MVMKKYPETDRARIMAESRATLKRLEATMSRKPNDAEELVPLDRVELWKRQAQQAEQRRARARAERKEQTV